MASLSIREINQAAARTGIGRQYILKEVRVFDIWSKICPALLSKEITAHAKVICKGGTSLNKVFLGRVQRFSEDLDMDIFFKKRLEREEKIQFIKNKIIPLVSSSYTVPKEARKRNIILFFCKFKNELGMDDNVQLEFNIGESRTGVDEIATARSSILQLKLDNIPVYSFDTLVAMKMKAFYEREEGKDVYDLYYSLRSKKNNWSKVISILKDVLRSSGIDYKVFKKELPNKLSDSKKMRSLHASTNPYIPKNLRIDFLKASELISKKAVPLL
ncbi:MAG TPA: nucleotidyl transferase AbiEii/AbiGii toxin family protein [Candidatus Nitrosotenuis sp.]